MFEKISYTWSLMRASWTVLKQDKEMLLFPLMSGIACLGVAGSFLIPLLATDWLNRGTVETGKEFEVAHVIFLFLYYLANYFVITFFNTAIVSCAVLRIAGGNPTVGDGLREAFARLPAILGWALIAATVGTILRMIEQRSGRFGRIVAGLLGLGWTLVSFLVVPILVVERRGPIAALKASAGLLRKTWGEQLIGNFSFGAVFFFLGLPSWFLLIGGVGLLTQGHPTAAWAAIGFSLFYLLVLALVQSALGSIFQAAVYLYTRDQTGPEAFPPGLLSGAVTQR